MQNPKPFLTPNRMEILELSAFTMTTAHILVAGGIVKKDIKNKLRSAQKILRNLTKAGYLDFHSYLTKTGRQKYYFLSNAQSPYHKIQPGILTHDSITALFLTHLFRCCTKRGIQLRWYPPFSIGIKESDGGVALLKEGEPLCSLLLESDMGTHDFPEIREKLEQYIECLSGKENRRIVFLTMEDKRKEDIQKIISNFLQKTSSLEHERKILCLAPPQFLPDMDILSLLTGDVPDKQEVPSEGTSKNTSSGYGTSL